jgi:hypothetical protein
MANILRLRFLALAAPILLGEQVSRPWKIGILAFTTAFLFCTVTMNTQQHGWLAWYKLSRYGEKVNAIIVDRQPELHQSCKFQYIINSKIHEMEEGGCEVAIGQILQITYLPSDPSFATNKSAEKELITQVLATLLVSIVVGFGSCLACARMLSRFNE